MLVVYDSIQSIQLGHVTIPCSRVCPSQTYASWAIDVCHQRIALHHCDKSVNLPKWQICIFSFSDTGTSPRTHMLVLIWQHYNLPFLFSQYINLIFVVVKWVGHRSKSTYVYNLIDIHVSMTCVQHVDCQMSHHLCVVGSAFRTYYVSCMVHFGMLGVRE